MSALAALVASWGGAPKTTTFVGAESHDESSAAVEMPTGTQAGDFCVVQYFGSRSITGGAGGWTTFDLGPGKVSYKVLEAADLVAPDTIEISDLTPVVVMTWRGPRGMSAARTSYSDSGALAYLVPGFTKSPGIAGLVGVSNGQTTEVRFETTGVGGPWQTWLEGPSSGWTPGMAQQVDLTQYADNADFIVRTLTTSAMRAAVYELTY